jgi:DHA2 family multidrug resistance protein-like MFS transporter
LSPWRSSVSDPPVCLFDVRGEFMAARVLIGLAGAGLIVMALSVLTVLFSKEERPKAVGIISGATFVAFPIGPILGGWLLTNYWWGWVFLINVPVVVVALAPLSPWCRNPAPRSAQAWTSSGWRPRPPGSSS